MKKFSNLSHELLVVRHLNGVRLERPGKHMNEQCASVMTLGELLAMPYNIFFKNLRNEFEELNEACLSVTAFQSRSDALHNLFYTGLSDKDQVRILIGNNQYVVGSENVLVVDESVNINEEDSVHGISFKFPWYGENNEVIGLFGCAINLDRNSVAEVSRQLAMISNQFISVQAAANRMTTLPQLKDVLFTSREIEVIEHIMRGKTMKEVGQQLGLSRRTIESYFQNIKTKANVKTRSQLFDKLMSEVVIPR